ncbi:IS66 family transposase [Lactiplantibacillus plantarum]
MAESEKDQRIHELEAEIATLKEQLAYFTRKIYASKSETIDPNQTSLFDEKDRVFTEPEQTGDQSSAASNQVQPKKSKKKTRQEKIDAKVPVRVTIIEPADGKCPAGHSDITPIGKKYVREELHFVPAYAYLEKIYEQSYKCEQCAENTATSGLWKSLVPPALFPHSLASVSLVAEVIYNKFVLGVPLYRQLSEISRLGYHTSEATLTNWVIKAAQQLTPLYEEFHRQLCLAHHLQGDETPIEVLREPGKAATSKSYMWVARTPIKEPNPTVYYAYGATRSGAFAQSVYEGYQGVLQCDGYSGYNLLGTGVHRMGCWAHVRRKFYDANQSHIKGAQELLHLIDEMFARERKWQAYSPRARRRRRRSCLRKILKRFWRIVDHTEVLPQSRLGKAITYAQSQRPYLDRIINDGVIDWSNNASERNMKSLVIGRKNWLFSTSTQGAESIAIWMTFIESAKANHIDPRQYLTDLLKASTVLPAFPKPEELAVYLPWNYRKYQNVDQRTDVNESPATTFAA